MKLVSDEVSGVLRTSLDVKFDSWSIGDIYFWIRNFLPCQIHGFKSKRWFRNASSSIEICRWLWEAPNRFRTIDFHPSCIPDKWDQKIHLYQVFKNPSSIFAWCWFRNTSYKMLKSKKSKLWFLFQIFVHYVFLSYFVFRKLFLNNFETYK